MSETIDVKETMGEPPVSLHEAILRAVRLINEYDPELFDFPEERFITATHHGLGQHMRNYWGLWTQDSGVYRDISERFGLEHADDLSGIILYATYRTKHYIPFDLETIAQQFHAHWKAMETMGSD